MRMLEKVYIAFFAFVLAASFADAKKVRLPNGKVLIDPYVISRKPDGLEVGHKTGIMFIKFKNMPVDIQKKYGYDPKKAAAYERKQAKRKQAWARKRKVEAERKRKITVQLNKNLLNSSINDLEIKIKEAENRVSFLKLEIPRLQNEADKLLNNSTKLAGENVSGNNNNNRSGLYYGWDGGYVLGSNSGNRQAESTKRRQVRQLGDDYSSTKRRLKKYQKEMLTKENEIARMKSRLKRKKTKRK